MVTWTSQTSSGDNSGDSIGAQIFNADGSPSGAEFLVNTTTNADQTTSTITGLADGGFVVSWTDSSSSAPEASGKAVRAQIFDADGNASGVEFVANTYGDGDQNNETITGLTDGRFVATWQVLDSPYGDSSQSAVLAQVFNADGSKSGGEFQVNTTTSNIQRDSSVTGLADGKFVVSWTDASSTGGDTSSYAVRAQVFNADSSKSGVEFLVNTETTSTQTWSSVTTLADGKFVISWTDFSGLGSDASSGGIKAQIFNADGSTSGVEFLVNSSTQLAQVKPSITGLADGRFVVSWTDRNATVADDDTSDYVIRAQVFNADGSKSGTEFEVNTTAPGQQDDSSITALTDGRFAITWTDPSATGDDTSGDAIRGQIFDPREAAVTMKGGTQDDVLVGTQFDDTLIGRVGDDVIIGEQGADLLIGRAGEDTLSGGDGNDTLRGGLGDDQLAGGDGNDRMNGGAGTDTMTGGLGDDEYFVDTVVGSPDVVVELADQGTDWVMSNSVGLDLANYANVENAKLMGSLSVSLQGNAQDNVLTGNSADNQLVGLDGNDTLLGRGGADILDGDAGDDTLRGAAGDDGLLGGDGDDTLFGGAGDDTLHGDQGTDQMRGGSGADQFVFNEASYTGVGSGVRDVIEDFKKPQGDMIVLWNIDPGAAVGNQAFTFIGMSAFSSAEGELRFFQESGNTIVQGDVDGDGSVDFEIELTGLINLTADDFVL